jgi:methionine aminopeptidase
MLDAAARVIKPGVTMDKIDEVVHQAIISARAYPSPLNYHLSQNHAAHLCMKLSAMAFQMPGNWRRVILSMWM